MKVLSPKYWQKYDRHRNGGSGDAGVRGCPSRDAGLQGAARQEMQCLPSRIKVKDRTKSLSPFGDHAGCRTAQNGKLEEWVSGPSAPQRTFQLSGFHHNVSQALDAYGTAIDPCRGAPTVDAVYELRRAKAKTALRSPI